MIAVLFFIAMRLGLKRFEYRLLMIRNYFFRFKIIMFLIGFFVAFFNFFTIPDQESVTYAMDKKTPPIGPDGGNDGNEVTSNPSFYIFGLFIAGGVLAYLIYGA
jgi:hypothetical protein